MATDSERGWIRNPAKAPRHHNARKLTAEQMGAIRRRLTDGETPKALALEYGVTATHIRSLR
ncbi:Hin recombinase [Streptomyces aquilus]|uniref:Hin recombinase n=1 Tax=Streptomyces aquilus TaxID=2548456 RepID=UPI0037D25B65